MTTKKTVQANYSAELVALICNDYAELMAKNGNDNKIVLSLLSEKHGKTVPSIRAKLASLKVYKTLKDADNNAPIVASGKIAKKEDIANAISLIVGVELIGLEAATKATLQTLLHFLLKINKLLEAKEAKINELIAEVLEDDTDGADTDTDTDNA